MIDSLSCSMFLVGLSHSEMIDVEVAHKLLNQMAAIVVDKDDNEAFFSEEEESSSTAATIIGILASLEQLKYKNDDFLCVFLRQLMDN